MSVYLRDDDLTLYHGDAATVLADLPEGSVDCVVTSPPYFGLRDYGVECQIGLEPTPEEYVAALVGVFRQVWRVLAPWGCCFVNIGDSYYSPTATQGRNERKSPTTSTLADHGENGRSPALDAQTPTTYRRAAAGLKPKDLLMMPARLALALQADGWWIRKRIVWSKPNPMPESVNDRCTSSHEDVYHLTKVPRYYYDAEAVREPAAGTNHHDLTGGRYSPPGQNGHTGSRAQENVAGGRNLRDVWTCAPDYLTLSADPESGAGPVWSIATEQTPEAHFATFPTELVRRCLAAGCKPGGTVLDPFIGSGTTGLVARRMGLNCIGIDASAEYLGIAEARLLGERAKRWVVPGPKVAEVEGQLGLLGGAA